MVLGLRQLEDDCRWWRWHLAPVPAAAGPTGGGWRLQLAQLETYTPHGMIGIIGGSQAGYEHIWSVWITRCPPGNGVSSSGSASRTPPHHLAARPLLHLLSETRQEQCQRPTPRAADRHWRAWILTDPIDNRPGGGHYTAMGTPAGLACAYWVRSQSPPPTAHCQIVGDLCWRLLIFCILTAHHRPPWKSVSIIFYIIL